MKNGERIGIAWQAVLDRLPEGWQITKVQRVKSGMVVTPDGSITAFPNAWVVQAMPDQPYAWKDFRDNHQVDGYKATGRSLIEAMLSLAIRLESGQPPDRVRPAPQPAVDALFKALFP